MPTVAGLRWLVRGDGGVSGDIGGMAVYRWNGRVGWVGWLHGGGSGLEQAPCGVPTSPMIMIMTYFDLGY
jgi:hypothetical protein